jgi:hypothetical protein
MDTTKLLMKGLSIQFGEDGTWLAFKNSRGDSQVICLENIPDSSGRIENTVIQQWSRDIRARVLAAQPTPAPKEQQ